MSDAQRAIVGVFTFLDDALDAVKRVKEVNLPYKLYSPTPRHEIDDVCYPEKSPVRMVSLTGAILGCTFGWSLAILTSMDWPLRTSAKDIVSVPAFFVPGYECTILFGGISTLLAMLFFCRVPNIMRAVGYDPRFSDDKFGVVVRCAPDQVDDIKSRLSGAGAEEVTVREGM